MIEVKDDGSPINFMRECSGKEYLHEPNRFFEGVRFVLSVDALVAVAFFVLLLVGGWFK